MFETTLSTFLQAPLAYAHLSGTTSVAITTTSLLCALIGWLAANHELRADQTSRAVQAAVIASLMAVVATLPGVPSQLGSGQAAKLMLGMLSALMLHALLIAAAGVITHGLQRARVAVDTRS